MAKKQRNKLKQVEVDKIKIRYESKLEEFKLLPLDELKLRFNEQKMSSTDRHALVMATNHLMKDVAEQTLISNEASEKTE